MKYFQFDQKHASLKEHRTDVALLVPAQVTSVLLAPGVKHVTALTPLINMLVMRALVMTAQRTYTAAHWSIIVIHAVIVRKNRVKQIVSVTNGHPAFLVFDMRTAIGAGQSALSAHHDARFIVREKQCGTILLDDAKESYEGLKDSFATMDSRAFDGREFCERIVGRVLVLIRAFVIWHAAVGCIIILNTTIE
jgi:hypothetical protein